jgi:hypothetical protein
MNAFDRGVSPCRVILRMLFLVSATLVLWATPAMAQQSMGPDYQTPALGPTVGPVQTTSSEPAIGTALRDNDVYLITPELWSFIQRYTHGELFDIDAELDQLIAKQSHVFSLYYFAGLVKVRRLLLDPNDKRDDKRIEQLMDTCVSKAQAAQRLPKYRAAGYFYEAMCEASLAMFNGVRSNWLATHAHGKSAMRSLQRIMEARPDLEGGLLFMGVYNYYTGRFGFFTKLLLRLSGMPAGDSNLGVQQLKQAASQKGPFHYFSNVYAVYAFAPYSNYRKEAYNRAEVLIRDYPKNYYGYLLRAYVAEKRMKYKQALADNIAGRALLPADTSKITDIILEADIFLLEVRMHYLKGLLHQEDASLRWLAAHTRQNASRYADAPLLACMYLGHLYSQADLDDLALRWYKKMQSFEGAEWMKDQGKYYEDRPMGVRRALKKKHVALVKKWLQSHPEIKP